MMENFFFMLLVSDNQRSFTTWPILIFTFRTRFVTKLHIRLISILLWRIIIADESKIGAVERLRVTACGQF